MPMRNANNQNSDIVNYESIHFSNDFLSVHAKNFAVNKNEYNELLPTPLQKCCVPGDAVT